MEKINSIQNDKIKELVKLKSKAKFRNREKKFLVEGKREIELALQSGFTTEKIFWCDNIINEKDFSKWILKHSKSLKIIKVSKIVYEKITFRKNSEGVLALVKQKERSILNFKIKNKNPIVLVLESIEKPGNIGAILRTSEVSKVDAVILSNTRCDLYNPNLIRSSLGAFFSVQTFVSSNDETLNFLLKNNFKIFTTIIDANKSYLENNYIRPTAFVLGSEDKGLSNFWRKNNFNKIKIPMFGNVNSLNVSVSAAILMYEVLRQKK